MARPLSPWVTLAYAVTCACGKASASPRTHDAVGTPHMTRRGLRNHAVNGKLVAVLVLGDPFRAGTGGAGDRPCNTSRYSAAGQQEASASVQRQMISPLESAGATVETLFTLPQACTQEQQSAITSWLGPSVVAHRRGVSEDICDGWKHAYRLLARHEQAVNRSYDYVFHTRHDLFLDSSWADWPLAGFAYPQEQPWGQGRWADEHEPPVVSWNSFLFEREMRMCQTKFMGREGTSCMDGMVHSWPMWDYAASGPRAAENAEWLRLHAPGAPEQIDYVHPWPPKCDVCARDHIMWIPRRFLSAVIEQVEIGRCAHSFIREVEQAGVSRRDMGFLFPAECDDPCWRPYGPPATDKPFAQPQCVDYESEQPVPEKRRGRFHTDLMCNEKLSYRPRRYYAGYVVGVDKA